MLELNFGSDCSELDNMVEGDIVRLRATLQGMEATKSTMEEHVQILEKDINRFESSIRTLEKKRTDHDDLAQDIDVAKQCCSTIGQIIQPHLRADMEKKYDDLKSRMVTGKELDDLMAEYQRLLQDCKHKHTYFATLCRCMKKYIELSLFFCIIFCPISTRFPTKCLLEKKQRKVQMNRRYPVRRRPLGLRGLHPHLIDAVPFPLSIA